MLIGQIHWGDRFTGGGLFDSDGRSLSVHAGQHERDVGGEEVVHLVAEWSLTQQFGAADQVADGHVEVRVARWPVGDASERVRDQDFLRKQLRCEKRNLILNIMKVLLAVYFPLLIKSNLVFDWFWLLWCHTIVRTKRLYRP